ncbi:MAG: hypothetical protein PHE33_02725 [Bacteroidales bacterium]|nr:hypothetical protein [Bacteroidales bacterium]
MKKILLLLFALISVTIAFAQNDSLSYEDFQKNYEDFLKQESQAFEKYKEDRDTEFSNFLKQDWESIELLKQGKPISLPGPKEIPIFKPEKSNIPIKKVPEKKITEIKLPEKPKIQLELRPLPKPKPIAAKKDYDFLQIDFYGTNFDFIYPKKFNNLKLSEVSEKEISDFWTQTAESDYYRLIEQMLEYKNELNLNDFAFLKLTEKMAASILSTPNEQRLLSWFLLSKTGYKIKVGYEKRNIHLLVPVVNLMYGYSYFIFDNLKYYVFEKDCQIGTLYTYKQDYQDANRIMNFNMYIAPIFEENNLTRNLKFDYKSKNYNFEIDYNKNLIDFYADYPQGEIQIFFDAGISHTAKESLDRYIDSAIVNMDEITAANFLLNFVQTAFSYQTDGEQFGYEKFFFPEEIFHYKHADCEDRSVFYSYLVNEYLNLQVIGLNYPGHIATAVKFNDKTDGMYFEIENERYVICDPTFINAPVGACMPEYVKSDVSILKLNNSHLNYNKDDQIWQQLINQGLIRTNYKNDIVKSGNGFFAIGNLQDSITINGNLIKLADDKESIFICYCDADGKILNFKQINGNGLLIPTGMLSKNNKIFISGYYNNSLNFENGELTTKYQREMFIAALDNHLNFLWIKNSGAIQETTSTHNYFNLTANTDGEILDKIDVSEQSYSTQEPIINLGDDKLIFSGQFSSIHPYLAESKVYDAKSSYEFAIALNELTQSFLSKKYDEDIASLCAFLTILESGKIKLKGKEIMAAIITMNPEFEKQYPKLYKNLRDIVKIKSKNDIVTIDVKTLDNFHLSGIIINDNARIHIRSSNNGNIQISVLSGITYKPFLRKHKVNYFKIYKNKDKIIINYDDDNDQKVIKLKKDILK